MFVLLRSPHSLPKIPLRITLALALACASLASSPAAAWAQKNEKLAKALAQKPLQDDVPFDTVAAEKLDQCELEETKRDDGKGFLVTGESGQTLRWFVDTNDDNKLDRWCYFSQGVETYREIDSDFDRVADQFRWLGTGGTRWGIDENKDGTIDRWKRISAEELTAEIVKAAAARDGDRFATLIATEKEIADLKLGTSKTTTLTQKSKDAKLQFESWAAGQNVVSKSSRWTHFGAEKPGIVPAGTDGALSDVTVYENVVALLETNDKPQQLLVGTLIQIGDTWRAIDLPRAVTEGAELSDAGVFFNASFSNRGQAAAAAAAANMPSGINKATERLLTDLQEADDKLQSSPNDQKPKWHAVRADVLEKLISASDSEEDRTNWIRQFADIITAATQSGEYPAGVERLADMRTKLVTVTNNENDLAYVTFRSITADYFQKIQAPNVNFPEAQKAYHDMLEQFVKKFPNSDDTVEAMIEIAKGAELVGDSIEATRWYTSAAQDFPNAISGKKAKGALNRLDLKGKKFGLVGKTINGKEFSSKEYAGSPVIYHYWASWCEPCKQEMRALKELRSQFAKEKLQIVGINVDTDANLAKEFLKQNDYGWEHIYEAGGLDGSLAVQLGVFNLPVNVVVDSKGIVTKSGIHFSELAGVVDEMTKK